MIVAPVRRSQNIRHDGDIAEDELLGKPGGDWIEDDGPLGSETTKTWFVNLGYRVDF